MVQSLNAKPLLEQTTRVWPLFFSPEKFTIRTTKGKGTFPSYVNIDLWNERLWQGTFMSWAPLSPKECTKDIVIFRGKCGL